MQYIKLSTSKCRILQAFLICAIKFSDAKKATLAQGRIALKVKFSVFNDPSRSSYGKEPALLSSKYQDPAFHC
jgi:hypothetical protein